MTFRSVAALALAVALASIPASPAAQSSGEKLHFTAFAVNPFTLIQIEVDKDGRGQGKMSVATRIRFDEARNVIELENYTSEPVRLTDVKMTVR